MYTWQRTQKYHWPILLIGVPLILFLALNSTRTQNFYLTPSVPLIFPFAILIDIFSSLTVKVGPNEIFVKQGIGLFQSKISLYKVLSIKVTKVKWYHGFALSSFEEVLCFESSDPTLLRYTVEAILFKELVPINPEN